MPRCVAVFVVWVLALTAGACGGDDTTTAGPTTVQLAALVNVKQHVTWAADDGSCNETGRAGGFEPSDGLCR